MNLQMSARNWLLCLHPGRLPKRVAKEKERARSRGRGPQLYKGKSKETKGGPGTGKGKPTKGAHAFE